MKKYLRAALSILLASIMLLAVVPYGAAAADDKLTFSVETKAAHTGEAVDIDVVMTGNPGIAAIGLDVSYDSEILTVENISFESAPGGVTESSPLTNNPIKIIWISASGDFQGDVVLATIRFRVSETVSEDQMSIVSLSYDPDDIYNAAEQNLACTTVSGGVYVTNALAGDINGDKKVNNKDVTRLLQYLAKWEVEVCHPAIDVNGDGKVNNKDVSRLMKYLAHWDVILYLTPTHSTGCVHTLMQVKSVAPTCEEAGNITYWHCEKCGKYFADANASQEIMPEDIVIPAAGHTPEVIPAVPATSDHGGSTEGSKCSVCGKILTEPQPIPILENTYSITYHLFDNDAYLQEVGIDNPNPTVFSSDSEMSLRNLKADGYIFNGWYTGEGDNGELIKKIPAGTTGNVELYARWAQRKYTITLNDQLSGTTNSLQYGISQSVTLPTPERYGYTFLGWSDEETNLTKTIPVGTTGNMTFYSHWTSNRTRTVPQKYISAPTVYEDEENGRYLFTYYIGSIENVPLFTIKTFGSALNIQGQQTFSGNSSISQSEANNIANMIANATTRTSAWTLPAAWNACNIDPIYSVQGTLPRQLKTPDGGWYLSNANYCENVTLPNGKSGAIHRWYQYGVDSLSVKAIPLEITCVDNNLEEIPTIISDENRTCGSFGESRNNYKVNSRANTASVTKYWNTETSYENSATCASDEQLSRILNNLLDDDYGSSTGSYTGLAVSQSEGNVYSAAFSFSDRETDISYSFSGDGLPTGYYRVVAACTVQVFAVVGFDIASNSYFTYSYGVQGSEVYPYLDYSLQSADFNDFENGVLPFAVPVGLDRNIDNALTASKGLIFDAATGTVTGYSGADKDVVIPDYISVSNGDSTCRAVKVSAISSIAFAGTDITSVIFGKHIREIPDHAFENCQSLWGVYCPNVYRIGESAFSSCTSLDAFTVSKKVESLGDNAFKDAPEIVVCANDAFIAKSGINAGARRVTVIDVSGSACFLNTVIKVPSCINSFTLRGNGAVYREVRLYSNASETVIDNASFSCHTGIPLRISSDKLTLKRVQCESSEIALVMTADTTELVLFGSNTISSQSGNAIVTKSVELTENNNIFVNGLTVSGNIMVFGTFTGNDLLTIADGNNVTFIDCDSFNALLTDESEWVLASDAPSDAEITDTKWTYTETEYTSSDLPDLPGYTQYDKTISGFGPIQGPYTVEPFSGNGRRVRSETITVHGPEKTVYHYYRYADSPSAVSGSNSPSSTENFYFSYDSDYPLTEYGEICNSLRGYKYFDDTSGNVFTVWECNPLTTVETTEVYQTVWYYQDIYYTYYYRKDLDKESFVEVQEGDTISNVQKWVKYLVG